MSKKRNAAGITISDLNYTSDAQQKNQHGTDTKTDVKTSGTE
jgi:hypothetical protein